MQTLKASNLIKLLQDKIKEYGDLPIFISDGKGEMVLTDSAVTYTNRIGFKTAPTEKMTTHEGRYLVINELVKFSKPVDAK